MMDLSDTSLDNNYVDQLIDMLYSQAGLGKRQNMDFNAFKKLFAAEEFEQTLEKATLGLQGTSAIFSNAFYYLFVICEIDK